MTYYGPDHPNFEDCKGKFLFSSYVYSMQNCVTNSQESPSVLPSDVKTLSLRPTAVYGIQVARTLLLVLYRGGKSLDVALCSAFGRIDICRSLGEDSRHRFAVWWSNETPGQLHTADTYKISTTVSNKYTFITVIDVFSVQYAYKIFGSKIIAMFRLCFDWQSRTQHAYSPLTMTKFQAIIDTILLGSMGLGGLSGVGRSNHVDILF